MLWERSFREQRPPFGNFLSLTCIRNFRLISPSSEGDGKEDGTADDEHFALVMGEAIKQYKERLLPPHIDEPFVKLLEGVQKVVDQSNKLYSFRLPGKPAHGPAFIVRFCASRCAVLLLTSRTIHSPEGWLVGRRRLWPVLKLVTRYLIVIHSMLQRPNQSCAQALGPIRWSTLSLVSCNKFTLVTELPRWRQLARFIAERPKTMQSEL